MYNSFNDATKYNEAIMTHDLQDYYDKSINIKLSTIFSQEEIISYDFSEMVNDLEEIKFKEEKKYSIERDFEARNVSNFEVTRNALDCTIKYFASLESISETEFFKMLVDETAQEISFASEYEYDMCAGEVAHDTFGITGRI